MTSPKANKSSTYGASTKSAADSASKKDYPTLKMKLASDMNIHIYIYIYIHIYIYIYTYIYIFCFIVTW